LLEAARAEAASIVTQAQEQVQAEADAAAVAPAPVAPLETADAPAPSMLRWTPPDTLPAPNGTLPATDDVASEDVAAPMVVEDVETVTRRRRWRFFGRARST
jgi:hypothetical protein